MYYICNMDEIFYKPMILPQFERNFDDEPLNDIDEALITDDYDSVYSGEEHQEETDDCDIEFE